MHNRVKICYDDVAVGIIPFYQTNTLTNIRSYDMARREHNRRKKRRGATKWLFPPILLIGIVAGVSILQIHRYENQQPVIEISGTDISSLSSEEAVTLLSESHPWNMKLRYEDQSYTVDNYIEPVIESTVEQAYEDLKELESEKASLSGTQKLLCALQGKKADTLSYDIKITDTDELARTIVEAVEKDWGLSPEDSVITGYDTVNGVFEYSRGQDGLEIDSEQLAADLQQVLDAEDYQAELTVSAHRVEPKVTSADYKKTGTYTTNTTANADRNTNVRLACEAINGIVLEAGEQFSFNDVVGERTPEKGYKEAAAYSMDEVVQEYGGGVCQVSSTLYNAVIAAGLQTDIRTGHIFKPTYVTPGQDATVSYKEPDFVFTNSSDFPIGIKATYWEQTVCVEIYGVPVLEDGVIRYLKSEKKSDLDPPSPTYIEDTSLDYGEEVISTPAEPGSEWVTNIVTEKNGQIIEETFLHNTRYQGKAAVIKRNTTKKEKDKEKDKDSDKKDKKDKDSKEKKTTEKEDDKKTTEATEEKTEAPKTTEAESDPSTEADDESED